MQAFWDARYGQEGFVYGKAPNTFFKEYIDNQSPGQLLLPCEGEGRNAIYAAQLGWKVKAFDYSNAAVEKARVFATGVGVEIDYEVASVDTFQLMPEFFDLIALTFVHLPDALRLPFFDRLPGALKPGGRLILQGFSTNQLGLTSGGPKDLSMLYTIEQLKRELRGLKIESLLEQTVTLDEGPYHQGIAQVINLIGKR